MLLISMENRLVFGRVLKVVSEEVSIIDFGCVFQTVLGHIKIFLKTVGRPRPTRVNGPSPVILFFKLKKLNNVQIAIFESGFQISRLPLL